MGIDVYVEDIFEANKNKYEAEFRTACNMRDKLGDEKARKAAQADVSRLYEQMYGVGYLRESYHGGPYVTRYLVGEAFAEDAPDGGAPIPAAVLRKRLPYAVLLAIYRDHVVYGERHPGIIDLGDNAKAEPGDVMADPVVVSVLTEIFTKQMPAVRGGGEAQELADSVTPEQHRAAEAMIKSRELPPCAMQFVEFVEQCEAHEAATGKPCSIRASW